MEFITCEELNLKDKSLLVVDIRDSASYSHGHIIGAVQADSYGNLKIGNFDAARKTLSHLPKDKIIITVCNMGMTAQKASKLLEEMGYKTKVLEGGMMEWIEKFDVERN